MFSLLLHPLRLLSVLAMFITWYVVEVPIGMLRTYRAYARALGEIISVPFLMKTLFSLWKGIADDYPEKGLDIEQYAATFCLNTFSRCIGCIIRLVTLVLGIGLQVLCFILFALALMAWIIYPAAVFFAVRFLLQTLTFP